MVCSVYYVVYAMYSVIYALEILSALAPWGSGVVLVTWKQTAQGSAVLLVTGKHPARGSAVLLATREEPARGSAVLLVTRKHPPRRSGVALVRGEHNARTHAGTSAHTHTRTRPRPRPLRHHRRHAPPCPALPATAGRPARLPCPPLRPPPPEKKWHGRCRSLRGVRFFSALPLHVVDGGPPGGGEASKVSGAHRLHLCRGPKQARCLPRTAPRQKGCRRRGARQRGRARGSAKGPQSSLAVSGSQSAPRMCFHNAGWYCCR